MNIGYFKKLCQERRYASITLSSLEQTWSNPPITPAFYLHFDSIRIDEVQGTIYLAGKDGLNLALYGAIKIDVDETRLPNKTVVRITCLLENGLSMPYTLTVM